MTFREFELYLQGHEEWWERVMELLAWTQANLINIQISRGKKLTVDDLLPRRVKQKRRQDPDAVVPVDNSFEALKAAREEAEHRKWLKTKEGQQWSKDIAEMEYDPSDPE